MTTRSIQIDGHAGANAAAAKEAAACVSLVVVTVVLFSALFDKENSLSYSIGYNLYGAERVLEGEVPYRDFHTLYTPAIVYLNAALFRSFGVTLYNALFGVLVFKILTTLALYLCARRLMPRGWALAAAAFSLIWLRPNGPFKAVPMHYGALFLALALWFFLGAIRGTAGNQDDSGQDGAGNANARLTPDGATPKLLLAGMALGVLALFKHNIGAYALLGTLAVFLIDERRAKLSFRHLLKNSRAVLLVLAGFILPVLPVLVYMQSQNALGAMIDTLLFGPGEFLLNRLAAVPSPVVPLALTLWLTLCLVAARKLKNNAAALAVFAVALLSVNLFALLAPQRFVDPVIFYAPVLILLAGLGVCVFAKRFGLFDPRALLAVTVFAAAAFMEAFPRFAREQAVAAMPFIALLLLFLLYTLRQRLADVTSTPVRYKLAFVLLPLMIFLMGGRLFFQTYFDNRLRFKSDTELSSERGRGVYFPADKAREIDEAVAYIRERIPADGYFFPQSYAGSSYLFLTDRNNPSGAQFWGGVGVKESERAATLDALRREDVRLVVTNRRDLEAERYSPMRDFIETNFSLTKEFGETLILER